MKKNIVSIIASFVLFFISNFGYAMNLAVLSSAWSSTTGASFTIIGLTVPYATGQCTYIFQDTTTLTNPYAEGGTSVITNPVGLFTIPFTNPTLCTLLDNFILLVNCAVIWNGFPDTAGTHTATITGACAL